MEKLQTRTTVELTTFAQLGSTADTTFIIKKDVTAPASTNGTRETVQIKKNVSLIFQGGSLSGNVNLQGSDTSIEAPIEQIFGSDIKLSGTWVVERAYPQWFDEAVGKESWETEHPHDCSEAINKAIAFKQLGEVFLPQGVYFIAKPIVMPPTIQLIGEYEGRTANKFADYAPELRPLFDKWGLATWIVPYIDGTDGFKKSTIILPSNKTGVSNSSGFPELTPSSVDVPIIQINTDITIEFTTSSTGKKEAHAKYNWKLQYPMPCGMIKDLAIWNYKLLSTEPSTENIQKLANKIGCIVGGGFTFENVDFSNLPRAIKWTDNYCDNKRIIHCHFGVHGDFQSLLSSPTYLMDMGDLGDALHIESCATDHNENSDNSFYRALKINQCYGGSIRDNILNTDVLMSNCSGMSFSDNHMESGAQLRLIFCDMAVTNNYFEKGKRPSIVLDVKEATDPDDAASTATESASSFSQVQLAGNTFTLYVPPTSPTLKDTTYENDRTPLTEVCPYDIALCSQLKMPYILSMEQNYRLITHTYRCNQPTGIMLATFQYDPEGTLTPLSEFNFHSYYLSTRCDIIRNGVIVAERYFNALPKVGAWLSSNDQIPLVDNLKPAEGETVPTTRPHTYTIQAIYDIPRKIASEKEAVYCPPNGYDANYGNLIQLFPDPNYPLTPYIVRLVRVPSVYGGRYCDTVDVPVCGTSFLYDTGYSVNGNPWQRSLRDPMLTPAKVSAFKINNDTVTAYGPEAPGVPWSTNDIVINTSETEENQPAMWFCNGSKWIKR